MSAITRSVRKRSRLSLPLDRPLLSRKQERELFVRRRSLLERASEMRDRLERGEGSPALKERIEALEAEATTIRNRILEANLRLIVSIAARFAGGAWSLDELVSECLAPVLRAIELFDVDSGNSFSTYATHTARNAIGRAMQRQTKQAARVGLAATETLDRCAEADDPHAEREAIAAVKLARRTLARLPERERLVLSARFGLGRFPREHTFREIGSMLGVSKERARVLGHQALETLREQVHERDLELSTDILSRNPLE